VARSDDTDSDGSLACSGEVWTDARGYATVALPRSAGALHGGLEYELRACVPAVNATVVAEFFDGRFTIATDDAHVKVAWRVRGRRTGGSPSTSQQ
jgi:hypothetical protein